MAQLDRQKLITAIVASVLRQPSSKPDLPWLTNKPGIKDAGAMYETLRAIFAALGGDEAAHTAKQRLRLTCDAYFGPPYNFILKFDEYQHFSTRRMESLKLYPPGVPLGYDIAFYMELCRQHAQSADRYRSNKVTVDFPFIGGRTSQRAYLDAVRDLLPPLYGLNPTVRISSFEVVEVLSDDEHGRTVVRNILDRRLSNR